MLWNLLAIRNLEITKTSYAATKCTSHTTKLVLDFLGTGYWVLGTGYWVLGTGYWVLGTGYWVLGTGYRVLATELPHCHCAATSLRTAARKTLLPPGHW